MSRRSNNRNASRHSRISEHRSSSRKQGSSPRSNKSPGRSLTRCRCSGILIRHQNPYAPPEEWHNPSDVARPKYRIAVREPGEGYRHILTKAEVRERLAEFPQEWLHGLDVVQFASMTRKKRRSPCYGLQWGSTIYLYPIEETLVEHFGAPPKPAQQIEAKMYGGVWEDLGNGFWTLTWTEEAIKDFYLNNVLIHELGHLLDDRNTSPKQRERYAEWFAIRYGYQWSRTRQA